MFDCSAVACVQGSRLSSRGLEYEEQLRNVLVKKLLPDLVDMRSQVLVERVSRWRDIWNTRMR